MSSVTSGYSATAAETLCCIDLFGGLRVRHGRRTLTRFRTHKTAALLAYLAFHNDRMHSREVLVEMLWPEAGSPGAARTSLSVALSSLRSQLEPPDVAAQSLLVADRLAVGLSPFVSTDTAQFEGLLAQAERARIARDGDEERRLLAEAMPLYRDVLLPGHYDAWIVPQQERLGEAFRLSVRRLGALHEQAGDLAAAVICARRAVHADPLDETAGRELIRLLLKEGTASPASQVGSAAAENGVAGALRQYQRLEVALKEAGGTPSAETRTLIAPFKGGAFAVAPAAAPRRRSADSDPPAPSFPPPDSPNVSPPPPIVARQTPAQAPSPLPNSLTRFYGRNEELAQIYAFLADGSTRDETSVRLVTLTGPGGSGKTRLALEAARGLRRRGTVDGDVPEVHFIPLQDADSRTSLIAGLQAAFGVSDAADGSNPLASLERALVGRPVLLVLDNLEQIADSAAPVIGRLLERLPDLSCLVTSRVRLPVRGEREVPVRPLGVLAPPHRTEEAETWDLAKMLREHPAIALFVDRAQLARPDFQITRRNAAAIVALTYRLEGIPLALELAAARSQVLTPRQMLERLEASSGSTRFDLLTSHRRVVGGRHSSLWDALNFSYELLPPPLRRSLAALSVFRGGWTAQAAEAVTRSPVTLDDLAQLCDASLLRNEETDEGDLRFTMLETIREFAREQLLQDEEEQGNRVAAEDRHRAFYASLAEEVVQGVRTASDLPTWFRRLESETDNCRAALRRVLRRMAGSNAVAEADALRIVAGLQQLWFQFGQYTEGRLWVQRFRDRWRVRPVRRSIRGALNPDLLGRVLNADAVFAMQQSDYGAAQRCYRQSLAVRRRIGDVRGVATVLHNWAALEATRGNFDRSRVLYEETLPRWQALDDQSAVARCMSGLGTILAEAGDHQGAAGRFQEAAEILQRLDDRHGLAMIHSNLGIAVYQLGDAETADQHFCTSLRAARDIKADKEGAAALLGLGIVRCSTGSSAGPQLLRIAVESHAQLEVPIPSYAESELARFTPATSSADGFPGTGLDALHHVLNRWLPEHGI